ncbi:hypothetical protein [Actinoplanes awajinensis]|uniref:Photosynthesis system II assembly factor Ycf48/Hcf136-like domain-containing protein n=1 Tax=Actinoplanes awajinensis subsp. mycoplanecinus TaxID=135947 RepID=A0A101JHR4_9ACTN|nr:hypothetical protein [Actinoplanes awajinensis]KUL27028.1 hypothetical protein ADL15_36560 [Actinoplanes awajinensis subsp. mycoplanecinus]
MREPDFERLRREVGDAVRQPDFFTVRRRARQVRRRRAVTSGAVFLATVLAATSFGYAVRSGPADGGPVGSAVSPTDGWPRMSAVTGIGDELYTLMESCENCRAQLYASTDAGASWQRRTEPAAAKNSSGPGTVTSLAPGVVVWRDARTVTGAEMVGSTLFGHLSITTDGGRSWRRSAVDTSPVAAVTTGTQPVTCEFLEIKTCVYAAVDPVTGRFAPLARQPVGIKVPDASAFTINTPQDGPLWVSGMDPTTHKPAVATSPDRGRTWRTQVFTDAATISFGKEQQAVAWPLLPQVAAGSGGTAYVRTSRNQTEQDTHYTADGGLTWHAGDTIHDARTHGAFVAADGRPIVRTDTGFLAGDSTGRYTPVAVSGYPETPTQQAQLISPHRYLAAAENGPYLSEDGRTWRQVPLP